MDGIHGTDSANGAGENPVIMTARSAFQAGQRSAMKKTFGFVEPHEEAAAKEIVDKQFVEMTGKPFTYKTAGYYVCAKIFVRSEEMKIITDKSGVKKTLWIPPSAVREDKYQSVAALVCGVGPQAYTGDKFPEGPWARVGDWITLPRQESFMFMFRGVPMAQFPDDRVLGVIEDPLDVAPINQADRI